MSTAAASIVRILSMPAASARSSLSTSVTSNPAVARLMAMPAPMVPEPSTPTLRTARGAASLRDSRSAKNKWRSARDASERRHSSKRRRDRASAAPNGSLQPASTHSMMASTEATPGNLRAAAARSRATHAGSGAQPGTARSQRRRPPRSPPATPARTGTRAREDPPCRSRRRRCRGLAPARGRWGRRSACTRAPVRRR